MKRITFGGVVLLAMCLVMGMTFPSWGADVIKIGVIGPMNFVQGKAHWNGSLMAADEINGKGGIQVGNKKMKIQLVKADSNEFLNITDATNAMQRLVTRDKVDFIVGGFRSEAVLAMQDIAMDYKKIFIDCGAAAPELCQKVAEDYGRYKYFFRGTPFNSHYLGRTCFIQMGTVGAILKKALGIPKVKVAVVAEKAMWADPMIKATQGLIPKMGMELAGIWRPSATATDVTAILSAIQSSHAEMIFTIFSASVGITFARQAGELKIPAVQVGINVEAQKDGFWEATQKKGDYVMQLDTYCQGVDYNDLTAHFVDGYVKRFGETPEYNAATYDAILYGLAPTIEQAGTLNADKLVSILEKRVYKNSAGTVKYMVDDKGRQTHDLTWGPGYETGIGAQWQNGKKVGVWPNHWVAAKGAPAITYKGIVPYKIPPWVLQAYKK
jgi:branched-chain amino acid transport system substrate-binding protein